MQLQFTTDAHLVTTNLYPSDRHPQWPQKHFGIVTFDLEGIHLLIIMRRPENALKSTCFDVHSNFASVESQNLLCALYIGMLQMMGTLIYNKSRKWYDYYNIYWMSVSRFSGKSIQLLVPYVTAVKLAVIK